MKYTSSLLKESKPVVSKKTKGVRKLSKKPGNVKSRRKMACKHSRHTKKISANKTIISNLKSYAKIDNEQNDVSKNVNIAKRWKTLNEREVLECYFELDPEWTRKTIEYIKDLVQLSEKQIYKWGYEKRRRLNVNQKEEKTVNMKFVTQAVELASPIDPETYNKVVDDLFPDEPDEEEVLTNDQKEIYDHVRDQLIKRNMQYEKQTDLEKLLNERIPIKRIALEAKASHELITVQQPSIGKEGLGLYKHEAQNQDLDLSDNQGILNFDKVDKILDFNKAPEGDLGATVGHIFNNLEQDCDMGFGSDQH